MTYENLNDLLGYGTTAFDRRSDSIDKKEQTETAATINRDPLFKEIVANADVIRLAFPQSEDLTSFAQLMSGGLSDLTPETQSFLAMDEETPILLSLSRGKSIGIANVSLEYRDRRICFTFDKIKGDMGEIEAAFQIRRSGEWVPASVTLPEGFVNDLALTLKTGRVVAEEFITKELDDGSSTY